MAKPDKPRLSLPVKLVEAPAAEESISAVGLGDRVIVKTPQMIGGQYEHAAIVTHVGTDGEVDVLLMPRRIDPYPVSQVKPANSGAAISYRS